ncbi:prolyl-tRNA editing protein [Fructobacillus sp. M2-14]|uniref:Prolyl-tRNA editing protein n=1 Tax=Fructobacillus broussonetiae TaxID=2713173 RepID=A0ABS5R199_9LACO|nr:YbaK/EbsC family protein [Fructobacillus broussonetiae]MBS9339219.1 prolyl-tRNA editing protein [Fructobacillus broussonetiae]
MTKATEQAALDLLAKANAKYEYVEHPPLHHLDDDTAPAGMPKMKNLLFKTKRDENFFLYMTKQDRIDIKHLAEELGTSKSQLRFASPEDLLALLGLTPGTVNPLALALDSENRIEFLVDQEIVNDNKMSCHPNQNEASVTMSWSEFNKVLNFVHHKAHIISE